jgi:hypothetical protein
LLEKIQRKLLECYKKNLDMLLRTIYKQTCSYLVLEWLITVKGKPLFMLNFEKYSPISVIVFSGCAEKLPNYLMKMGWYYGTAV